MRLLAAGLGAFKGAVAGFAEVCVENGREELVLRHARLWLEAQLCLDGITVF